MAGGGFGTWAEDNFPEGKKLVGEDIPLLKMGAVEGRIIGVKVVWMVSH